MKRDGNTVLYSMLGEVLYSEKSTYRAFGVTQMMESIPKLIKQLADDPQSIKRDLETIRQHSKFIYTILILITHRWFSVTNSREIRFSVSGNVLALPRPRSIWKEVFGHKILVRNIILTSLIYSPLGSPISDSVAEVIACSDDSRYTECIG